MAPSSLASTRQRSPRQGAGWGHRALVFAGRDIHQRVDGGARAQVEVGSLTVALGRGNGPTDA